MPFSVPEPHQQGKNNEKNYINCESSKNIKDRTKNEHNRSAKLMRKKANQMSSSLPKPRLKFFSL